MVWEAGEKGWTGRMVGWKGRMMMCFEPEAGSFYFYIICVFFTYKDTYIVLILFS